MPVAGTVEAANEELESTPTLVNISAYEQGWMVRIRVADSAAVDGLMTAAEYIAGLAD